MGDGRTKELEPLKILVFLGSVRESTPPRPARLGARVAQFCIAAISEMGHSVDLVDPLEIGVISNAEKKVFKPHFAYPKDRAPQDLQALASKIKKADGYVMVSPEYNHSMSPALADLLNHFGSSLFSYKPSAIVTYSAGQWGGARAAVNMRTYLSELGCLPVSAMVHLPKAQDVLTELGNVESSQDFKSWDNYGGRCWKQLEWWALATRAHRQSTNAGTAPQPFLDSPKQRDAGHRNR